MYHVAFYENWNQGILLNTYLLVGVGGAAGALSRYLISNIAYERMDHGFPYGTLAVNLVGSLLIGFLYFWLINRFSVDAQLRAFLIVGFLGAFTTFSAFSIESLVMLEQGAWIKSAVYISLSVVGCIAAAMAGMMLARLV